jgi:hypothetical protein
MSAKKIETKATPKKAEPKTKKPSYTASPDDTDAFGDAAKSAEKETLSRKKPPASVSGKATAKAEKKATPKAAKERKVTPSGMIVDLLLQKKFSDEDIRKKVVAEFGEKGSTFGIGWRRTYINDGKIASSKVKELGVKLPLKEIA